ncbi:hypothetical protein REPUB_Repub07fG0100900 [Reevesia pubescens]
MAVGTFEVDHVNSLFVAEASAARKALELASEMGFHNLMLEGDSSCIIKSLLATDEDLSPIGPIIEEIREYLSVLECVRLFMYLETKTWQLTLLLSLLYNVVKTPFG